MPPSSPPSRQPRLVSVERSCNDAFFGATTVAGPSGTASGSTNAATGETGEPNHAGASAPINSVWCRWIAPATGAVTFDTTGSLFNTTLAVYTGQSLSQLTQIAANDNISAVDAAKPRHIHRPAGRGLSDRHRRRRCRRGATTCSTGRRRRPPRRSSRRCRPGSRSIVTGASRHRARHDHQCRTGAGHPVRDRPAARLPGTPVVPGHDPGERSDRPARYGGDHCSRRHPVLPLRGHADDGPQRGRHGHGVSPARATSARPTWSA